MKAGFVVLLALLIGNFTPSFAQQSVYYETTAIAYRDAASKTKCPAQAEVYEKAAKWCDCMVEQLAGRTPTCPPKPKVEVPPCDENSNTNSNAPLGSTTEDLVRQQQENSAAASAFQQSYNQAKESGSQNSGAILQGTVDMASQLSDTQMAKSTLIVGGAMALLSHMSEQDKKRLEEKWKAAELEASIESQRREAHQKIASEVEPQLSKLIVDATQGDYMAAFKLGQYYFTDVIPRGFSYTDAELANLQKGLRWYALCLKDDYKSPWYRIAKTHLNTILTVVEAMANGNDRRAFGFAALMNERGLGTDPNRLQADYFYKKAEKKNPNIRREMAELLLLPNNEEYIGSEERR